MNEGMVRYAPAKRPAAFGPTTVSAVASASFSPPL